VFIKDQDTQVKNDEASLVVQTWQRVDGDKTEKVGLIPGLNSLLFSFEQQEGKKITRLQLIDLP
jgi:hypothetical protein